MTPETPPRTLPAIVMYGLGAAVGFVVAVIVVLNLHILAGLEEGYAATPAEVLDHSVPLAVVDVVLLVGLPVFVALVVWRRQHGARAGDRA